MRNSSKKLVLFIHKTSFELKLRHFKHIFSLLIILNGISAISQEKDKSLQQSNDFIFEGNSLISEDFVEAEKEYRKGISKKQTNAPGSYNLGNAYYNSNLFDEALLRHIEAAQNATNRTEKHNAFHNIGNALMKQEQCKEAVEAYKNALRNDPTDDESRYNLAIAKDCANKQGEGEGEDKDEKEDEKEQDKEDQEKEEQDKGDENEDNEDKGDENEDQNEGDDQEDKDGKPKDEKGENKSSPKDQKQQQQPGKLSPQQVKSLLEAMNNEEKKVQEKINARKAKGVKVKREKDW